MIPVVPAPFGAQFRDRAGVQNGAALTGKSEPFTLWRSDRSAALPAPFGLIRDNARPSTAPAAARLSHRHTKDANREVVRPRLAAASSSRAPVPLRAAGPAVAPPDPGPTRYPHRGPRRGRSRRGRGAHLHNINISGGNIGVLNTGTVTSIDNAVGILMRAGSDTAAIAIKQLTEAIAEAPDITAANRQRAIESLSVIATEAVAPPAGRRVAVVRALLQDVVTVTAATGSLVELGQKLVPIIEAAFS